MNPEINRVWAEPMKMLERRLSRWTHQINSIDEENWAWNINRKLPQKTFTLLLWWKIKLWKKIRELDLEFIGKSTEFERNQWKRLNCVLQDERTQSHSIKKKSRARNLNWKPKKKTQHTEWSLPWTIYISVVSLWKKKAGTTIRGSFMQAKHLWSICQ